MLNIVDTIYKMRATLEVLVAEKRDIIMKAKMNYFRDKTFDESDSDDSSSSDQPDSNFFSFMKTDYLFNLNHKFQRHSLKKKVFNAWKVYRKNPGDRPASVDNKVHAVDRLQDPDLTPTDEDEKLQMTSYNPFSINQDL